MSAQRFSANLDILHAILQSGSEWTKIYALLGCQTRMLYYRAWWRSCGIPTLDGAIIIDGDLGEGKVVQERRYCRLSRSKQTLVRIYRL